MAAGFRKVEEIIELGRAGSEGGADFMTLPPDLLDGLRTRSGVLSPVILPPRSTSIPDSPVLYFSPDGPTEEGFAAFEHDSKKEAISLDKVPEGLDKFSIDAVKLEEKVRALLEREVNLSEISKSTKATSSFVKRAAGVTGRVRSASGEVCRQSVTVQAN
jgi:transaldolase